MNISSRCDYACRAIVELAHYSPKDIPLTANAIATKRNIPEKYLVHILLQLKKAGMLLSVRGAQGGYRLAKKASDITLLDVVLAVDGSIMDPVPCDDESSPELKHTWEEMGTKITDALQSVTIQSILDNSPSADMYFI